MAKVDLSQPALLFLELCKKCTISPHEMKLYLKDRHILTFIQTTVKSLS